MTKTHDVKHNILQGNSEDELVIKRSQEITQDYLDSLKDARNASIHQPMGEMHRVASLPNMLVEMWKSQGFDIMSDEVGIKEIIAKLRADGLDYFITTDRKF